MSIIVADAPLHWSAARELVQEYVDWLGIDLSYQNFAGEFSNLETMYSPPNGCFFLVDVGDEYAACVAFRDKGSGRCEMKRLYTRPKYQGQGWGQLLSQECIRRAKEMGFKQMILDTLPHMKGAINLYAKLGFMAIPPYYHNPVPDVLFLGLDL